MLIELTSVFSQFCFVLYIVYQANPGSPDRLRALYIYVISTAKSAMLIYVTKIASRRRAFH